MLVATGAYTGDGAVTQAIVGVGFQPTYVVVFKQVAAITESMGRKTDQDGLFTQYTSAGTGGRYEVDHIISLDVDGFTVGDGTGSPLGNVFNVNLVNYTYIAFGGGGNYFRGAYTGDGAVTQAIAGVGFQPTVVIIYKRIAHTQHTIIKTDQDGLNTKLLTRPAFFYEADHVISLDVDGFTVGDGTGGVANVCNVFGVVYTYVALR